MDTNGLTWTIVLAAGDGRRLRTLTADVNGDYTPKQFCSLRGERSLLEDALARAGRLVPRERTIVVVAAAHERWWRPQLAALPPENIVVQPQNRGTGIGILLPLVHILRRDTDARVVVMASDHYVGCETTLTSAFRVALERLASQSAPMTLLGITPDSSEADYGWIVPGPSSSYGTRAVRRFVEKPDGELAGRLHAIGALWNSFLLVARGRSLLRLYGRRFPAVVDALLLTRTFADVSELYASIDAVDFCRDLLQGAEGLLRVLPVPACGWTDLGTPDRVLACLNGAAAGTSMRQQSGRFDLSARLGLA